jgi:hypothetical protein
MCAAAVGSRAGRAAAHEMQQEQDQGDDQDNVDETGGYVKCEKAEQPENDEDCCDYPKHVFISLLPNVGT